MARRKETAVAPPIVLGDAVAPGSRVRVAAGPAGEALVARVVAVPAAMRGAGARRSKERVAVLRSLSHAGVAGWYGCWPLPGRRLLLAWHFVEGVSLQEVLARRGRLRRAELAGLAQDLLEVLAACHAQGFAHGDLSPANIVMTPQGHPVLIDLASGLGEEEAAERGTPGFASPERLAGGAPTPAADVYSLGMLLRHCAGHAQDLAALCEHLTRGACDEDPSVRATLVELRDHLAPLAEGCGVRAVWVPQEVKGEGAAVMRVPTLRGLSPGEPLRRRRRWRRSVLAAGATVSLMAGGTGLVASGEAALPGWLPTWFPHHAEAKAGTSLPEPTAPSPPADSASGSADAGAGQQNTEQRAEFQSILDNLTRRRDEALMSGEAQALAALTVEGSQASERDARLLASLHASGDVITGVHTSVRVLQVSYLAGAGGSVSVRVEMRQASYQRRSPQGSLRIVPAGEPQIFDFVLVPYPWRVASVTTAQ